MSLYLGTVYKYIDQRGAVESLRNGTLKFTKASKTNDPFECHPGLLELKNPPS